MTTPADVVSVLTESLRPAGLDLIAPFRVRDYDAQVPARYQLPEFGRDDAFGVVIGNTRAIWAPFIGSLAREPSGLRSLHPLDRHVERAVTAALAPLAAVRHQVRWAHARLTRFVAIQRVAYAAGLAFHAPCRLAIHPEHGLWIGLRAAIAFDLAAPPTSTAPAVPHPCDGCSARPCLPAFEGALATTGGRRGCDVSPWQAVREACQLALAARYEDAEIRYHYTKDRAVLRAAVAAVAGSTDVR